MGLTVSVLRQQLVGELNMRECCFTHMGSSA